MNWTQLTASASYYLEIGQSSLKALNGEGGLELALERQPGGRLTPACKQKVSASLQGFLKHNAWERPLRVVCAIGARGVSLRRLKLPASAVDNASEVLRLQLENELPISPDLLAWGYVPLGQSDGGQEYLLAAVRKETLEDYAELFGESEARPVFTVAALARSRLCEGFERAPWLLLEIGRYESEIITFDHSGPVGLRTLFWGGENVTHALSQKLGISRNEAEEIKLGRMPADKSASPLAVLEAIDSSVQELAGMLSHYVGTHGILVVGKTAALDGFEDKLSSRLSAPVSRVPVEIPLGEGQSVALQGLKAAEKDGESRALLALQTKPGKAGSRSAMPFPRQWAIRAGALALALLLLPYAEALVLKPFLKHRLEALKLEQSRLGTIDQEMEFLQYLKQSQPPYLDALYVLSKTAPMGTRLESVSMNRRGELALRGAVRDGLQLTEFRAKLIDSGFFSSVTVEEQVPTPDRQKLNFRLNAQWKPYAERQALALGPTPAELEKGKGGAREGSGAPNIGPGAPPAAMTPPGASGGEESRGKRREMPRSGEPAGPPPPGAPPGLPQPTSMKPGK
jgi:Tfp pilus assembly PilM family ATPase